MLESPDRRYSAPCLRNAARILPDAKADRDLLAITNDRPVLLYCPYRTGPIKGLAWARDESGCGV